MQETHRLNGLPPDEIIRRAEKALKKAGDTHTWADVVAALTAGQAQAFWNEHGIWITEIMQSPRKCWLHVWIVAGELPGVMDLQPQVLAFAKEKGCFKIVATARFGWKHVAKAHGWKSSAVVITHEV